MRRAAALLALIFTLWSCSSSDLEKGRICLRLGDAERAVGFLEQAIHDDPANLVARRFLAEALQQKVSSYDTTFEIQAHLWRRSVQEYRIVYSRHPDSVLASHWKEAWLQWCAALEMAGDSMRALHQYREMLQWFPVDLDVLNATALRAYRKQNWSEAESLWTVAIQVDTTSIIAPFNLGMGYWLQGHTRQALEHWVQAFERNPQDTNVIAWMVQARQALEAP